MHHDERVLLVDTVRAIHFGGGFLVEVDIVLPPEMPLHEAHDIGEELQVGARWPRDSSDMRLHHDLYRHTVVSRVWLARTTISIVAMISPASYPHHFLH